MSAWGKAKKIVSKAADVSAPVFGAPPPSGIGSIFKPKPKGGAPMPPPAPAPVQRPPDFSGGYDGRSGPVNPPGFSPGNGIDPRLAGMADWMKTQRQGDLAEGTAFANKYFGAENPEMKAILAARHDSAFGPDAQTNLAREAGNEGINRSVQTAMRQFAGRLPGTGVHGGAAGAMAGMLARDAVGQTRGLERDLAINEMERRRAALGDYEHSVTGERAGALGTALGYAGMGSNDRYGSMGYLQGQDFMKQAQDAVNNSANPLGNADRPWYQKQFDKLNPFSPGQSNGPWDGFTNFVKTGAKVGGYAPWVNAADAVDSRF